MPSGGSVQEGTPAREPGRGHIYAAPEGALSGTIPGETAKSMGWGAAGMLKHTLRKIYICFLSLKISEANKAKCTDLVIVGWWIHGQVILFFCRAETFPKEVNIVGICNLSHLLVTY